MESFTFEHTHQLSEDEYVRLTRLWAKPPRWRSLRFALFVALGIVCLFWSYTLLLGVAVLSLAGFAMTSYHILPTGARANFRRDPLLRSTLTYGVSDREFWIRANHYEARAEWPALHTWQRDDEWLVLSGSGMPWLFFPVEQLESAGVLERVIQLVEAHGIPFGGNKHRHEEAQFVERWRLGATKHEGRSAV